MRSDPLGKLAGPLRRLGRFWPKRLNRLSLRWRLSLSFVGITVVTMAVVAAVLVPLMARHYSGAQETYLKAAVERAVRDLSGLDWREASSELIPAAERLALLTQTRVMLRDPWGKLLVDSGLPQESFPASSADGDLPPADGDLPPADGDLPPADFRPMPSPLGAGLFGGDSEGTVLSRSDASIERPVREGGRLLGYVALSEAPDYAGAAFRQVLEALGLAGLLAVVVAGLVGWLVSLRLSSPIRILTKASDRMAHGDLGVRAVVGRRDEVGQLADSFNTMADEVEKTVALRQRFVADAAHEFGTPLTALQANLELAMACAQTPEERDLIDASAAEAHRLERLSADLLRLSRLEAGQARQPKQLVDLTAMVRRLGDAVASRAEQKEIDIRMDVPEGETWVPAYGDQLEIALGNLVDNALKFTSCGGGVVVGLRRYENRAVLWVEDDGPGIAPEDLPRLFERFHRGRNAAEQPGSGLGLAIVRAVMDLHDGSVQAESGPKGSCFRLTLAAEG